MSAMTILRRVGAAVDRAMCWQEAREHEQTAERRERQAYRAARAGDSSRRDALLLEAAELRAEAAVLRRAERPDETEWPYAVAQEQQRRAARASADDDTDGM